MPLRLGELTNCVTGYERTLRDIAVTATLKGN